MTAPNTQNIVVEGFILDQAFVDLTKNINGILTDNTAKVASLNQKALSYFTTPFFFTDTRTPSARVVNWASITKPSMMIDENAFTNFVNVVNNDGTSIAAGFFKIVDKLFFDYNSSTTTNVIETYLTTDADTSAIYVPGSFILSSTIVNGTVYQVGESNQTVGVPEFISFTIAILSGTTTENYEFTLYTSVSAFLNGYSVSTISAVIPPLPYTTLYSAPLLTSSDNIFTTSNTTANLQYNTTQALLGDTAVSGSTEYLVTLVDSSNNQIRIPFNIMYKGQVPTTTQIRLAIQNAELTSGVGTEAGWKARTPGLYITGRFYIIPLWDKTYTKAASQVIYPNISKLTDYSLATNKIMASLGHGDLSADTDVLSVYFNRMTVTVVPDLSGVQPVADLTAIIPDYQNYSTVEESFQYMSAYTQTFSSNLNTILSLDYTNTTSTNYTPSTEALLTFYTFNVGTYEMCVITKNNYMTIVESTQ